MKRFVDAKNAVEQIVDGLPQRDARLFVKNCKSNGFKLSKNKLDKFFPELTDDEISRMEDAVKAAFME